MRTEGELSKRGELVTRVAEYRSENKLNIFDLLDIIGSDILDILEGALCDRIEDLTDKELKVFVKDLKKKKANKKFSEIKDLIDGNCY